MEHKDVLKLDGEQVLAEFGQETPTHIPNDIGFARRYHAATHMTPIITNRDSAGEEAWPYGPWSCQADVDFRLQVGYQSGSGNISSMMLDGAYVERSDIPLLTEYETFAACGACKGSSGGCPGFAPLFVNMKRNVSQLFVFIVHYDFKWAWEYSGKHMKKQHVIRQLTYMDRLTDSYLNRLRKYMQKQTGCFILGVGNCLGCQPSKCAVIQGKPCKYPTKRTFSMEATGIDCDELHHQLYDEYLPWYYRGTNRMPVYMSRYMAVFVESGIDYSRLLQEAALSDKYYVPVVQVPELDPLPMEQQVVPSGVHTGYIQYVYGEQCR